MATKTKIRAVKGTRDFYPEVMALRNWLYDKVRAIERYLKRRSRYTLKLKHDKQREPIDEFLFVNVN